MTGPLRSLLRRLSPAGRSPADRSPADGSPTGQAPGIPVHRDARTGQQAVPIQGIDPSGEAVSVQVSGERLVIVFLTSSCRSCQPLWAGTPPDSTVLVTPSPSTESRRRVGQLARSGLVVVMSSEAWDAYGVRRAPWLVIVDHGLIAVDGPAPSCWDSIGA